jgi:SAM-dependent methyltransferase
VTRLFAATLFVSAVLLFSVQPMVGRMVLPTLGGAPAVWNTCLVFFQAALLAGYLYAHLLAKAPLRAQAAIHTGTLLLAVGALSFAAATVGAPLALPPWLLALVPRETSPVPWLLLALAVTVGLPFFVLSASAPLLQRWFAATADPQARDPYFLYAASNAGSLLALLGYPLVLEPTLGLRRQGWVWAAGCCVLVALVVLCARKVPRAPAGGASRDAEPAASAGADRPADIPLRTRLRWLALAAVPSSLLLGVTTYLSTDIAPIPLLWVVPLALYLLTFVLVFARRSPIPHRVAVRILPITAMALVLALLVEATEPILAIVALHVVSFVTVSMVCHGELARERPDAAHVTTFYLWLSLGGVVGGLFNALLAPSVFPGLAEYPIALVAAFLLRPAGDAPGGGPAVQRSPGLRRPAVLDFLVPPLLGALALAFVAARPSVVAMAGDLGVAMERDARVARGILFAVPLFLAYLASRRPRRYGLTLAALLLAAIPVPGIHGRTLHAERNFFGVVRVTDDPHGEFHRLVHGSTIHGRQAWGDPPSIEPLSYYALSGPIGEVFVLHRDHPASQSIAIVGLGAGTLASYAHPDERWTFYEIDPAIERIARDPASFTFLRDAFPDPSRCKVEIGDARLRLADAPDRGFGLIVLDAFNSDAIPVHLMTREALALALRKLAPGGRLAFHISNRYLDLRPVLANLARDAAAPLVAWYRDDSDLSDRERERGKLQSAWVVLAARREDLGRLAEPGSGWEALAPDPNAAVWTDDFSNVLGVFRLR